MSLADAPRISARDRHDPHRLLDARDEAVGVRVLTLLVRAPTAHEHDGAGVGRPAQVAHLLPIVIGVRRHGPAGVVRRRGDPDVSRATGVEDPGHGAACGSGGELVWKRRAHHLLDGEGGLLRGERSGGEKGE